MTIKPILYHFESYDVDIETITDSQLESLVGLFYASSECQRRGMPLSYDERVARELIRDHYVEYII